LGAVSFCKAAHVVWCIGFGAFGLANVFWRIWFGNHRSPASPPCWHNVGYGRAAAFAVGEGGWVTQYLLKGYCRTLYDTDFLQNFTPTAGLKNPAAE